jgi:hypothetical protein
MPSIEFDDQRPPRSRDELLATVRHDGLRRRHRRQGLIGGLAMVLVAALAMPVVAGGSDRPEPGRVAALDGPGTTTTVDEADPTTTTTTDDAIVDGTTTTTSGEPSATPTTGRPRPAATTTTTTIACRNSTDPRCGSFRWDPDPGPNAPLTIEITKSPAEPKVGQVVTFTVHSSDPDAGPIYSTHSCEAGESFGDEDSPPTRCPGSCVPPGYGPWTPPPRQPGSLDETFTHTYTEAGGYWFTVWRQSAAPCGPTPYRSSAEAAIEVHVS